MIYSLNYANGQFKYAQKMNTKTAYEQGVDKVLEYSFESLPDTFLQSYARFFENKRGNGLWVWKPFIILDAVSKIEFGDYLIYSDAGAAYINKVSYLISSMEKEKCDIMPFSITPKESQWSKRDAFVLMGCDEKDIIESPQMCATYLVIKKTPDAVRILEEYMKYCSDYRIMSDDCSVLGENYEGFIENRHDQTVWSLLCKKEGIKPFRDPSEFGLLLDEFDKHVIDRSPYPQIFESHRIRDIKYKFELDYVRKCNRMAYIPWYLYRAIKKIKKLSGGLYIC